MTENYQHEQDRIFTEMLDRREAATIASHKRQCPLMESGESELLLSVMIDDAVNKGLRGDEAREAALALMERALDLELFDIRGDVK